jgi:polysaccharide biosynthesis transport protein
LFQRLNFPGTSSSCTKCKFSDPFLFFDGADKKGLKNMDIKDYIRPLIRWWWVILAASIVAGVSTFFYTRQQAPIYQARTTLVIGSSVYQANPTSNDLYLGQSLARFYADLAQRKPTRAATMEALGLNWLPSYVVQPLPNSQLIEIIVSDTNPLRAQVVANELVNQLINLSPAGPQENEHQDFITEQLYGLEASIRETKDEIAKKQDDLKGMVSARQINEAEADIRALQGKMTTLQTNYANLVANSQRGASNKLTVIEPANLPTTPIGPNQAILVLLSAGLGFVLAAGAAYLLEYIDDTLKTSAEVARYSKSQVIGYIGEIQKENNDGSYITKQPRSLLAESFRYLRTNIEIAAGSSPLKVMLVTSSGVGDGKTSIAANLATVMAQGGKKVVLIDTDLRKPRIHKYLGLENTQGLTDLFHGRLDLHNALKTWNEEKVFVITAGELPHNPAELLASKKMDKVLESLKHVADIIILDGPPLLVVDAAVLASKADGVLMVARHSHTRRDELKMAVEQLNRANVMILGIAFNSVPRSANNYYSRYSYYTEQVLSDETNTDRLPKLSLKSRRLKLHCEDLPTAVRNPELDESNVEKRTSVPQPVKISTVGGEINKKS